MPELFVAGRWRPAVAGGRHEVVNPCDGEVLTVVDEAGAVDGEAVDAEAAVLAARAVQTLDADRGDRVAAAPRHGTAWSDDSGPCVPQAGWGGQRMSGNGRELGSSGLAEHRESKHVWCNPAPAAPGWFTGA